MVKTQCPHCDQILESDSFPKGASITCSNCQRVFLPVITTVEATPEPPAPPAPAAGAAVPAPKATQEIKNKPQRIRVASCPKCRALLRLGPGDSKFGRCGACSHVFVFDRKTVSELVLPASEVGDLPALELFDADIPEGDDEGGATIMRTTARMADAPGTPSKEKMKCVLVSESPRIRHELDKDIVLIGRVNADVVVKDPDISRRHCTIEQSSGNVIVRDLKSTNGTLVNGVRVELEVLKDGDVLRLGSTELRLVVASEGERDKFAALLLDLGPSGMPQDVNQCLDIMTRWAEEQLGEWKPDVIRSPSAGRGLLIWPWNAAMTADERRRVVPKMVMAPAALRVELQTVPLPSGAPLTPLVVLLFGLAKRSVVSGRAKFEGPLLQKASLAVKVPQRDAVFASDVASLEMLFGEKGPEAISRRLHEFGLRAGTVGKDVPFVAVHSAEAVKAGKKRESQEARPLLNSVSTIESELLAQLAGKCESEFAAGLAMSFSSQARSGGGVFAKLRRGSQEEGEDVKVKTRLYEQILGGSGIYLGKDDMQRWMELLGDIGVRYADALRAERERVGSSDERSSDRGWDDLLALKDDDLLAASEAAVLFRAAFFKGNSIADADLRHLATLASEAVAAAVPAKYQPVPLPTLGRVYDIFRDAVDQPSDALDAKSLFEFFVLLSLAGVTHAIGGEALRMAQHIGDSGEVEKVKRNYGAQQEILKIGLGTMSRLVSVLKLAPPLRAVGSTRSIFSSYQLPAFEVIP